MSRRNPQLAFSQLPQNAFKKGFGGSLLKSHPKVSRPISSKQTMHLVLRSSKAKGVLSFLKPQWVKKIETLIYAKAKIFGVKVYGYANGGNHLHLVILPRNRRAYLAFIRAISGLIPRLVLGAERGKARGIQFWDARPFTRLVSWGKDYLQVSEYLLQNTLEAIGFLPYHLRLLRRWGQRVGESSA